MPEIFAKANKGLEKDVVDLITFDEEKKYNSNDIDHNGNTILHIAASNGLIDVMRKCLVWGTDPNILNKKVSLDKRWSVFLCFCVGVLDIYVD